MPTIHVKAILGKTQDVLWREGDILVAHIKGITEEHKSNAYLEEYLAKRFGCSRNRVSITRGHSNQHKIVVFLQDERVFKMKLNEIPELPQLQLF